MTDKQSEKLGAKGRRTALTYLLSFTPLAVFILCIDIIFFYQRQFDMPLEHIEASTDPAVISRGEYLVYGPARCADCHGDPSQRDAIAAGKTVPLSGGFLEKIYLGTIVFPNITPDIDTGIGQLSDEEIARFMRTGINHRGEYGLPFMNYQAVSQSDLIAILSFLRSQQPVKHKVDSNNYNFLGRLALAYFIRPENPVAIFPSDIEQGATAEYGSYLVEALGSCRGCHTNRSLITGEYLGEDYAGGMLFEHPDNPELNLLSPSLRPDPITNTIAGFSKEAFVTRMQAGHLLSWSPMPWGPFSRMTTADLEAIYLYLLSLDPLSSNAAIRITENSSS